MNGTKLTERDLYLSNLAFVEWLIARTGLDTRHQTDDAIHLLYCRWMREQKARTA